MQLKELENYTHGSNLEGIEIQFFRGTNKIGNFEATADGIHEYNSRMVLVKVNGASHQMISRVTSAEVTYSGNSIKTLDLKGNADLLKAFENCICDLDRAQQDTD